MNTQEQDRQDTRLRSSLTAAYPSTEPSDALRHRIQEETVRRDAVTFRRIQQQWRARFCMTFVGAAVLTVLAAISWPTLVAAQTLHRMEVAVSEIKQMHSITWDIRPDGSREKLRELWVEEGRARLETPGRIELFADKTLYSYVPQAKRVTVKPQERNPFLDASDLSIGTMVRSVLLSSHPERIHSLDDIELNGQLVKRVAINMDLGNTTTGERAVLYAEAQSDLPIRCDNQRLTHNGWLTEQTIEVRYHDALASDLFQPNYPKDVRLIDAAAEQKRWRQIAGSEIDRVQTGNGLVIIHDFQVSAEGDVFLLSSGGDFGGPDVMYITHKDGTRTSITRPSPLGLTDDLGTHYLPQFNFGGQPNVQRWTPLTPMPRTWQPRRFTITFRSGQFSAPPYRLDSPAAWTVVVDRPESAVMPEYLPNVNPGLYWNETRILADDAVSRAEALRTSGKPGDLEKALAEYHRQIGIEDAGARASGGTAVHPEVWFGIYSVLRDLGRTDEAREALQTAQDQDVYHNMNQEIAAAWQKIGRSR